MKIFLSILPNLFSIFTDADLNEDDTIENIIVTSNRELLFIWLYIKIT